jgi:hypothetical protein
MEFRTEVKIPAQPFIELNQPYLLMGSCFSEHIGKKLTALKLDACINPFGILYQPAAIANALTRIINRKYYVFEELVFHEGLYHSADHHGVFSGPDANEVLSQINNLIDSAHLQLKKKDIILLITWGTAKGFKTIKNKSTVGNCHKLPASNFESYIETPEEIVTAYRLLILQLKTICPTIKMVFSISPVRHKRDGFVANQHSKSVLFVALHQLLMKDEVHYFPAYEILMDELRDYRYFANDMLHPSEVAVNYIWDKFISTYFNSTTLLAMQEIEKVNKLLAHRPIHQNRTAHLDFLKKTEKKLDDLIKVHPFLDYREAIASIKNKINTFENHD